MLCCKVGQKGVLECEGLSAALFRAQQYIFGAHMLATYVSVHADPIGKVLCAEDGALELLAGVSMVI